MWLLLWDGGGVWLLQGSLVAISGFSTSGGFYSRVVYPRGCLFQDGLLQDCLLYVMATPELSISEGDHTKVVYSRVWPLQGGQLLRVQLFQGVAIAGTGQSRGRILCTL